MSTADELVTYMTDRQGRFAYSQAGNRLQPDATGTTDCSGIVYAAYRDVAHCDIGTWTGTQVEHGTSIFGTEENSLNNAVSKLAPADLIFFTWSGHNPTFDHVEMYIGGGQTIGHGGPGNGPTVKNLSPNWNAASEIVARRYVGGVQEPIPDIRVNSMSDMSFGLPQGQWWGDINGPDSSHGGINDFEKIHVMAIQQRLVDVGFAHWPEGWVDGIFEQPTVDAVAAFQRARMPGTQFFGQVWGDDWAELAK